MDKQTKIILAKKTTIKKKKNVKYKIHIVVVVVLLPTNSPKIYLTAKNEMKSIVNSILKKKLVKSAKNLLEN